MKNIKRFIFPLSLVLLLAACNSRSSSSSKVKSESKSESSQSETTSVVSSSEEESIVSSQSSISSISSESSEAPAPNPFVLEEPEDTSMVSEKVKAYVDAMREQEESLDDPYMLGDGQLGGEQGVQVENFLDEGDVNGKNQTVNGKIPDRSDKNMGVELKFSVAEGYEAETYKVLVADNEDFENAKELETSENEVTVRNLFVNTEYYWKVVTDDEESDVETFTTGDYPRWILARSLTGEEDGRGIYNVRDNGGYMTSSGKRVKQGLVYRGGEITTMTSMGHYNTITEVAKKAFREDMGMVGGIELDLRGSSDISDGYRACGFAENGDIEYEMHAIKSYEQTFTNTRSEVAPIFEILKTADERPVYYHCFGGADRTGTIGFLLNGLLGVSYTDLVIDFELTSYSSINNEHIRSHIQGHQHSYDRWPALINQIKTDTTGGYAYDEDASLEENIEEFLLKACSVPQETIDTIRDIMLED